MVIDTINLSEKSSENRIFALQLQTRNLAKLESTEVGKLECDEKSNASRCSEEIPV